MFRLRNKRTSGNRLTTTRNARTSTYTPNDLNQYEGRTTPGYVDVLGEADPAATVMVDGKLTQRTSRDFHRQVGVSNASTPVYIDIEIDAEIASTTVSETRQAFIPQDPEIFTYDLDGNLTSDGRWAYEWDAANQLRSIETLPVVATLYPELNQRLEFAYDYQGRRIQKVVKEWDAGLSGWQTVKDLRFIYDGWNLIEERDALNNSMVLRKHVWGPDLSGTMQGAGGVGGLLWTQTPTQTFAASTDANGNIVAWINIGTLAVSGRIDYTPFGEPIVQTGVARDLPFGFSTKYVDSETQLAYYGYRYYSPGTGRWLSRDPINESGSMLVRGAIQSDWGEEINLYAFVVNDPVSQWDYLGLAYFAYRPLDGFLGWGGVIGGSIDDKLNTVIGHEQLFFEDGKSPSNIGFFSDGTLQTESDTSKYRSTHDSGYDDCIMRQAVANVPLQAYCLLGKPGKTDKFNCQDWAEAVREEYRRLVK